MINLRALVDGEEVGPLLQLTCGGFSQIPFPTTLEGGEEVRVRANIDRYFSDQEVWLSPEDDDSFIQEK